jgi:hypothetical protein
MHIKKKRRFFRKKIKYKPLKIKVIKKIRSDRRKKSNNLKKKHISTKFRALPMHFNYRIKTGSKASAKINKHYLKKKLKKT